MSPFRGASAFGPRLAQLRQRFAGRCSTKIGLDVLEAQISEAVQVVVASLGVRRLKSRPDTAP